MTNIRRSALRGVLAASALLVVSAIGGAQGATALPRWQPWVGCWQALAPDGSIDLTSTHAPIVCVTPSFGQSVEVVTVDSGKVLSRYTVDASGQQRAVNRDGCTGWEKAVWSRDSLRVFLRSELNCGPGLKRVSSGIMSITSSREWIDVQTVAANENQVVRSIHYRDIGAPSTVPADVASAVASSRRLDARTAQIAAGVKPNATMIVEASRSVDAATVQAWLVERNDKVDVDAKTLVALADAGVPGSVTDVMVALAYPDDFRFSRGTASGGGGGPLTMSDSARIASQYLGRRQAGCDPYSSYSPFGWGEDPCFMSRYGYYGLSRYDYRSGYGYGLGYGGGYGYGYGPSYGYYSGPIVIVRASEVEHGRAVKGQGYTRGSSGSSGSSASGSGASSTRTSSGSSGSSESSGSSGSSGSSSSGSSGSSGRTAVARPPNE